MASGNGVINSSNLDRQRYFAKLSNGSEFKEATITEATAYTMQGDLNGVTELEFFLGETAGVNAIGAFSVTVDFYDNDSVITGSQQVVATGGVAAGINKYVTITGSSYVAKADYFKATFTLPHSGSDYTATINMLGIGSSSGTLDQEILTAIQTLSDVIYTDGGAFTSSASKTVVTSGVVNPTTIRTANTTAPIAVDEIGRVKGSTEDPIANATRTVGIDQDHLVKRPRVALIDVTNTTSAATFRSAFDFEGLDNATIGVVCAGGITTDLFGTDNPDADETADTGWISLSASSIVDTTDGWVLTGQEAWKRLMIRYTSSDTSNSILVDANLGG